MEIKPVNQVFFQNKKCAALSSDRPYRKAFDISTVIELMIDEIKNFDMEVFLAFQRVVHNNK